MYTFHATIHAKPPDVTEGPSFSHLGTQYGSIVVASEALATTTFGCSFEQAQTSLTQLNRMYCEPDGSFVWVSSQNEDPRWQVDGNLYDRAERLLFVDVKGSCPAEAFDQLLNSLGWPETAVVFQLAHEAVLLDEPEFRRWASRG
jgi:hypothetical protein